MEVNFPNNIVHVHVSGIGTDALSEKCSLLLSTVVAYIVVTFLRRCGMFCIHHHSAMVQQSHLYQATPVLHNPTHGFYEIKHTLNDMCILEMQQLTTRPFIVQLTLYKNPHKSFGILRALIAVKLLFIDVHSSRCASSQSATV